MTDGRLRGSLTGRLGFRLMVAVGLALTPLAVLSYTQSREFEAEAQARWESALFGETVQAAMSQIDAISRTQGLASALAIAIVPNALNEEECRETMRAIVEAPNEISFAGFVPKTGLVTCTSSGTVLDVSDNAVFKDQIADPRPTMTVNAKGPISGESVLIFSHPVNDADQQPLGFVSVSLPHRTMAIKTTPAQPPDARREEPLELITFNRDGLVLTAAFGIETVKERLPVNVDLTSFVGRNPTTFRAVTPLGDVRTFAVLPVVPNELYVLGSWPAQTATSTVAQLFPLWVFPTLMWLASLLAAWIAAEHQVLRHVRSLRRSIIAFAGGNRLVDPPKLSAAPDELRDVGDAYERMMSAVLHDEAELEDSIHQKEVLLREVHHRVKNNLQLIASIMNLQMRKSVSPEARSLLKGLHERVMSLATVHRELYQTSGLTDVRADELLESIVAQVMRMGATPDRRIAATTDFDPIRLTPDQAVPLSLIVTETLMNALKHATRSPTGVTELSITLKQLQPGHVTLEVANSSGDAGGHTPGGMESTGLGMQLLNAFSMQLTGVFDIQNKDGRYVVRLTFPVLDLSLSENRNVADDATPEPGPLTGT